MDDARLLETLARASTVASLNIGAPRGAPIMDRLDVLGAIGGCRATIGGVPDMWDAGPELLQIEAGVKTRCDDIVPALARATVEQMFSHGKTPEAAACQEGARYAMRAWMRPGERTEKPGRIEDCAKRARISKERMIEHIDYAGIALQCMRDEAMTRFRRQIMAIKRDAQNAA